MKSKDAYALEKFDKGKILQRPFFKKLELPTDKTDEELLAGMGAAEFDTLETTQEKLDALDKVLVRLAEYQNHIKRHGDRLTKYTRAVEYKITTDESADVSRLRANHERARKLQMDYCGCVTAYGVKSVYLGGIAVYDIGGLCDEFIRKRKELDEKIKSHYRKIFAERLKTARKAAGLSQSDLSEMLGMTSRAVSNYEQAIREPTLATLVRFSQKLKRPVGWFLGVS